MKFSLSSRLTMMAMVAFTTLATFGDAAPCEDNPDFSKKGKTCDWVKKLKKKQQNKRCRKKKFKKNCPQTCNNCKPEPPITTLPITVCPPTKEEMVEVAEMKQCLSYETGLRCSYESSPNEFYECTASDGWLLGVSDPEPPITTLPITVCPPTKEEMVEVAEMKQCLSYETGLRCSYKSSPNEFYECTASEGWLLGVSDPLPEGPCDSEPVEGSSCQPGIDGVCFAEYTVRGCTSDALFCSPGLAYSCSGEGQWKKQVLPQIKCKAPDPLWGMACSPDGCPPTKPKSKELDCSLGSDETCFYDYEVLGCTSEQLQCKPRTSFKCDKENRWLEESLVYPTCIADKDPRSGEDCSPLDCPVNKPNEKDACTTKSNLSCEYDFLYKGCDPKSLACTGTSGFICQDNAWVDQDLVFPECAVDDPRWNTQCQPGSE